MPLNEAKRPGRRAQLLSLCLRAGKLTMGYDAVKETVLKGRACLLAVSWEASDNTRKRMQHLADEEGIPLISLKESLCDLWYILGKRAGVLCITDRALAQKILNEADPADGGQTSEAEAGPEEAGIGTARFPLERNGRNNDTKKI